MRPLLDTAKVVEKLKSTGSPPPIELRGIVKSAITTVVINTNSEGLVAMKLQVNVIRCEFEQILISRATYVVKVNDSFRAESRHVLLPRHNASARVCWKKETRRYCKGE